MGIRPCTRSKKTREVRYLHAVGRHSDRNAAKHSATLLPHRHDDFVDAELWTVFLIENVVRKDASGRDTFLGLLFERIESNELDARPSAASSEPPPTVSSETRAHTSHRAEAAERSMGDTTTWRTADQSAKARMTISPKSC